MSTTKPSIPQELIQEWESEAQKQYKPELDHIYPEYTKFRIVYRQGRRDQYLSSLSNPVQGYSLEQVKEIAIAFTLAYTNVLNHRGKHLPFQKWSTTSEAQKLLNLK